MYLSMEAELVQWVCEEKGRREDRSTAGIEAAAAKHTLATSSVQLHISL